MSLNHCSLIVRFLLPCFASLRHLLSVYFQEFYAIQFAILLCIGLSFQAIHAELSLLCWAYAWKRMKPNILTNFISTFCDTFYFANSSSFEMFFSFCFASVRRFNERRTSTFSVHLN